MNEMKEFQIEGDWYEALNSSIIVRGKLVYNPLREL